LLGNLRIGSFGGSHVDRPIAGPRGGGGVEEFGEGGSGMGRLAGKC